MLAKVRQPRIILPAAVAIAAAAVAGVVWFQPQKLLVDTAVDEAAPRALVVATPGPAAPAAAPTPGSTEPMELSRGAFRELTHHTVGRAVVLRLADGSRVVRFEDFETSNGPDVVVWLSTATADSEGRAFAEDFVDLGALKGNRGNQNYVIPAGVDLSRYRSVVVWCRRFTVPFGAAPIVA